MNHSKHNKVVVFFTSIIILSAYTACKKAGEFDDRYIYDPNPRANTFANTSELLTKALYASAGRGEDGNGVNGDLLTLGDKEAAEFVQYISEAIYPSSSLYASTYGEWSSYYAGPLMALTTIIDYNSNNETKEGAVANGSNNNQLAVARIWKAYLFSIVTDRWGDVPYFEANKGVINPRYDRQQDIYNDLFKELKEAVDQFDNGAAFKGDILFNGDAAKWKKFANSVRMTLALRLSKVDPATGKAQFVAAMEHPAGYIISNADNAVFNYQNNRSFRNPWNNNHSETNAFGVSEYFVNLLKNNNDPRLPVLADPASAGVYTGIPYGLDAGNLANWVSSNSYSKLGTALRQQNSPGYFITATQVLLTRADAALMGWISGTNAKNDYEAAIRLDMQRAGITNATAINNYLSGVAVAINTANVADALSKVRLQKYIALFPNGYESFSEWRRTGVPPLTAAPFALNSSRQIPRRWGYPTTEATLNSVNYQAAINSMGGSNSIDGRVWWDKP